MAANPGFERQTSARTGLRVVGTVLVLVGAVAMIGGMVSFFSVFSSDSMEGPKYFWLCFAAVPFLAVGGWCLSAGFLGAATRFVAGETVPVAKDSLEYLTGGKGLSGLGVTAKSRFCTQCGTGEEQGARFCSQCGTALA